MRLAINHESSGLVRWWQSFVLVRASACSMAHVVTPLVIFGRHSPIPKLVTFLSHSSTKHPPTPKCHGCDKNCRETLPKQVVYSGQRSPRGPPGIGGRLRVWGGRDDHLGLQQRRYSAALPAALAGLCPSRVIWSTQRGLQRVWLSLIGESSRYIARVRPTTGCSKSLASSDAGVSLQVHPHSNYAPLVPVHETQVPRATPGKPCHCAELTRQL